MRNLRIFALRCCAATRPQLASRRRVPPPWGKPMNNAPPEESDADRAPAVLQALGDPRQRRLEAFDIAVIVAHPDDETISCGAQLGRLQGVTLIVVSDGAPRNLIDAHAHGFSAAEEYALA